MARTTAPKAASSGLVKRFLVGRRVPSQRLEHTLLPKILALPVFSSDALSSVAYATEEILTVLLGASVAVYGLVMPIATAIAVLMVIVVSSYRQTVRAYPNGGGAYIVSRENLGTIPGLVAAAALLVDYVLTVSVSVVAGAFALTSAVPSLVTHRVLLSLAFVVFITLANLRGVRESGTLFAVPTFAFIASILLMLAIGLVRCVGGCPAAASVPPIPDLARFAAPVGLFTILRAFASGSTALTGVEAISNGVPAFRRPQARNASETLAIMAVIAITMFLGISFLASHMHVTVSEHRSVVAQVAYTVFGGGFFYYVVQSFTTAILILAANTSFQDFPRLSAILARDRFMPRQFMNRGDRLVFSNGVIVLAALAAFLIYVFDASLTHLIQLYVVGVFTSFTLSQSGMVIHWLKEKHKGPAAARGWRRSMVINAIGATATFVVLIVVLIVKFTRGAWVVVVAVPIFVMMFLSIHRHYGAVMEQLRQRRVRPGMTRTNHVLLLVSNLDAATGEALGYVRSFRPSSLRALYVGSGGVPPELRDGWRAFCGGSGPELQEMPSGGSLLDRIKTFIHGIEREPSDFVTVIVPEVVRGTLVPYLVNNRSLFRLKLGLLREKGVVVTDVPVVIEDDDRPVGVDGRPLIPRRTVALVFVSAVNDATIRALNYARSLGASETRAVYFDLDPETASRIEEEWIEAAVDIPLDVVEAPFRDLTRPILDEVRRATEREDTVCAVVIPEFLVSKWRYLLLHNQNALFVKRLLLTEPRVILSSVPYVLAGDREGSKVAPI
ncbi:MAG TPA: APC family permease [Actinomycetota bacterium]|jgi:amino acid transporter|nr:APC family permease [Actinomycetota bacterium]